MRGTFLVGDDNLDKHPCSLRSDNRPSVLQQLLHHPALTRTPFHFIKSIESKYLFTSTGP